MVNLREWGVSKEMHLLHSRTIVILSRMVTGVSVEDDLVKINTGRDR